MTDDALRILNNIMRREPPDRTVEYIARLDRWLSANRPDYYVRLRSGATDAELDEFERLFGLKLPDSFRAFYRWRDGQEDGCDAPIVEGFMLMPLEVISSRKELLDGMIGHDFESPAWWQREWVPFLDNGVGDHLCLDLTQTPDGLSPLIRRFWHDTPDRSVKNLSFQTWMGVLVESMEGGALRGGVNATSNFAFPVPSTTHQPSDVLVTLERLR